MKSTMIVSALVLSMAAGCTTLHQVELTRADSWMAEAQNDLLNNDVTVTMVDGSVTEGKLVRLNADSICLQGKRDGRLRTEPLDRVQFIRPPHNALPAVGGVVGGGMIGAIIGTLVGMENEEPSLEMAGTNTLAAGLGGAVIGIMVGAAVGGVTLGLLTAVTDYSILPAGPRTRPSRAAPAPPDSLRKAN